MNVKVKVCCISSIVEARMAISMGADHVGLVGPMPSGPGTIPLAAIREITDQLPDQTDSWLLTSKQTAHAIVKEHGNAATRSLQLVDHVPFDEVRGLRQLLPGVKLIQVIHVIGPESVAEAVSIEPYVDAILLDSGNPTLKVKKLGGTGRTHNWSVSRSIVEAVQVPVYLAGGLRPNNVAKAIDAVQPSGVDLCSGVRIDGHLDRTLLQQFMREAVTSQSSNHTP
ncbi:MAG: phosphoribosylanthranilate isomerase [Saprospiraceae bacterium]|nr:phosphoribosylanthranilate isomerase [Saprospiraceae bacterium]